jgi:hypothetical protein
MLDHPFAILGWIVASIGFLLLLAWVPTSVPSGSFGGQSTQVFNAHKSAISSAVMSIGFVMVIAGTVARGFERLFLANLSLTSVSSTNDRSTELSARSLPQDEITQESDLSEIVEVLSIKDRQGNDRQVKVSKSGAVVLQTVNGQKAFSSVDEARAYLA